MTYIKQLTGRGSVFNYRFLTMILAGCALLLLQSGVVQAQWTNGTNINNTNSGTVSVGTTSPGGDKLIVSGNTVGGNITSHTQLYTGYDGEANSIMELSYGTATANLTPYPTIVLSKNLTSANQLLGVFNFANRSIADGNDRRIAQIAAYTDATTNSGALAFRTMNAGTADERVRITSSGDVGVGTTTPLGRLHTVASGASNFLYLDAYGTGNMPLIYSRVARGSATAPTALANGDLVYDSRSLGYDGAAFQLASIIRTAVDGTVSAGIVPGRIQFYTTNASGTLNEVMRIDKGGNVGIGTATAVNRLVVTGDGSGVAQFGTSGCGNNYAGLTLSLTITPSGCTNYTMISSPSDQNLYINRPSSSAIKFRENNGNSDQMVIASGGNVGIGISTPASKLDVNGNANVTGTLNVTSTITGGNIVAKYQDVAEWVQSSQELAAGTVVVLDHTKSNQVIASSQAYDTRVAGVISLQPGITLGENGAGKVLVATTGRVKVKVDASAGPIQIGDLLVTSEKEGVARKSEPLNLGGIQIHRPGTLIGKALEPLEKGTGEILVLLSLQ